MKTWFAALLVLLALPAAAGERCPAWVKAKPRSVAVSHGVAPPAYHNQRSRAEITRLAGREGVPLGMFNTGLTRSGVEFRLTPEYWWVELGQGRRCVGLGRVEARWAIAETAVDIAAEYPPGTCQYQVVREHEEQHVELTSRAFLRHLPKLEPLLRDLVGRVEPFVTTAAVDEAGNRLTGGLMAGVQPLLDAYERERRAINMAIDTPENYRRVSALCKQW